MYTLERPTLPDPPEEIFERCVRNYKLSPFKVIKLLPCKELVKRDAGRYEAMIRAGERFPKPELPENVKFKEMYAVYDDKFSKSGTKIREQYYDSIIENAAKLNKPCPICGEKGTLTLDHYLPKSEYPTLCVTPDNLIPICTNCNTAKGSKCALNGHGEPVHLYFDRLPEIEVDGEKYVEAYLFVRLGPHFEAEYYVACPPEWDSVLCSRLSDQMEIYELCRRFGGFAVTEMGNLETQWRVGVNDRRQLMMECGKKLTDIDERDLWRRTIKCSLDAEMKEDSNSWKTALCRALYENVDDLITWLESKDAAAQPAAAAI